MLIIPALALGYGAGPWVPDPPEQDATLLATHSGDNAGGVRADRVRVSGRVRGLYPGAKRRLRLRVRNRFPFKIAVRLSVRHRRPQGECPAGSLVVGELQDPFRIGSRKTRKLRRVVVRMRNSAPDACQRASYPLMFIASSANFRAVSRKP